jgi:hypothetical protein
VAQGSRSRVGRSGRGPLVGRVMEFLATPAVFLASNWAALLMSATVVGLVPALSGAARVTVRHEHHRDDAFRAMWRWFAATVRRDWPISLAVLVLGLLAMGNLRLLELMEPQVRVFLVGVLLPATWVAVALAALYVVAAARCEASDGRGEVARVAFESGMTRPLRALVTPALLLVLSPVVLLAPLTLACGFSLPPWVIGRVWGMRPAPEDLTVDGHTPDVVP